MDREHRRAVVELHPPVGRYAYILTEFAYVASNVPKTDLVAMVQRADDPDRGALEAVQRLSGMVPPLEPPEEQGIEDPYRRSMEVYERSSADIVAAVNKIAEYFKAAAALSSE